MTFCTHIELLSLPTPSRSAWNYFLSISSNVDISVLPSGFHERRVGGPLLPFERAFKWADLRATHSFVVSVNRGSVINLATIVSLHLDATEVGKLGH